MARTRFTHKSLEIVIAEINDKLKESGSDYNYRYFPRNGGHAVDLQRVEQDGNTYVVTCIDCHEPPRVLADKVEDHHHYYMGRKHDGTVKACSRCKTPVKFTGVSKGYTAVCPSCDEDLYSFEIEMVRG